MPVIRPVSDLRNNFNEISDLCHRENEPVFITKQGKGDMVIMSQSHYEMLLNLVDLHKKLREAEAQDVSGDPGISHLRMMERLRKRIG